MIIYHYIIQLYTHTQEMREAIVKDGCLSSFIVCLDLILMLLNLLTFYWAYFIKTAAYIQFLKKYNKLCTQHFCNPIPRHRKFVSK